MRRLRPSRIGPQLSFDKQESDMKQGQGSKRSRGRNSNRRGGSGRSHSIDSNGPSIRIRGNAWQVHEKYLALARDANITGDPVAAENFFQHAEHYYRIVNAKEDQDGARGSNGQGRGGRRRRGGGQEEDLAAASQPEVLVKQPDAPGGEAQVESVGEAKGEAQVERTDVPPADISVEKPESEDPQESEQATGD